MGSGCLGLWFRNDGDEDVRVVAASALELVRGGGEDLVGEANVLVDATSLGKSWQWRGSPCQ